MRNNEDRIGTHKQVQGADEPVIQQQVQQQAQSQTLNLSFITPTELVDLPSAGKYYPEGHPLKGKAAIEIKQMTAKEEDILTNKSFLKKGVALDRLIESLIIDRSINPESILSADRNAIFLAARISAYGHKYNTQVVCPSCEKKSKYTFDLLEKIEKAAEEGEEIEINLSPNGTFFMTLPSTKWVVECKPIVGSDEKKLSSVNKREEFTLLDQIKMLVVSIQGMSDKAVLSQALGQMPASDCRYLRKQYDLMVPTVDLKGTFICDECNYEEVLEVPLTADFFWPK